MTTNVFDGNAGLIATDSRWSISWSKWVVYVDDVRFEKIERYLTSAFMFAGQGLKIQEWKNWIRSAPQDDTSMPTCDGLSVCIVDTARNVVTFSERQDIVKDGAYFAGSGSRFAYVCWDRNRNAQKSVETAKTVDIFTGGEVKFLDAKSGQHNLYHGTVNVTIDMVGKAIETRGMVMEIAAGTPQSGIPFKLSELAANDKEMKELQAKIANGELHPEAPCDGMYSEWSDDQTKRLKTALAGVFSWK
jgi:hypothetical protein